MEFWFQISLMCLFLDLTHAIAIKGDNVRDATEPEFPFTVAIIDASNDINPLPRYVRQFCTSSLITTKHVLTAEHCVVTKQVQLIEVLIGSVDLDRCTSYDPQTWITYQKWKYNEEKKFPPFYHDVAVITLKHYVTDANVRLAVIPKFNPEEFYGRRVRIAGWGFTNQDVKPRILRTVDLTILSKAECEYQASQLSNDDFSILDWELCATADPWALNACGDSGGPLINQRNEVIGIIMGTCPPDDVISENFPRQLIYMNRLMDKRINMHASLHFYQDFIEFFYKK